VRDPKSLWAIRWSGRNSLANPPSRAQLCRFNHNVNMSNLNSVVAGQFEAALSVLHQALEECPEEAWSAPHPDAPRSFQAYLDDPKTKAGVILEWLKATFDIGRGHGMALVHVLKYGPQISDKHVGTGTAHSDPSNLLQLDGKKNRHE